MIEKLIQRLNALYPMGNDLEDRIQSITKITKHPKGAFILREGEICKEACMVAEGLVRSFYINEGKDVTSRFMDEGFIITSWVSFYTQEPGNEFIETLEDTTLASIAYRDAQQLYNDFPIANIIGRKQVEYSFYLAEQRTQMLRKHTAEEKYKFFLENHPSLLQRVSLKHIASYLGMNQETLSRVRSKFHKNNT